MRKWRYKLMSDEGLMLAYGGGDPMAFEPLYRRHKRALFLFIRRQCDKPEICEDLAHDAWLAVIRSAQTYTASARFKTWLYRIAHHRLVDHWRKHGHSAKVLFEELSDDQAISDDSVSRDLELTQLMANLSDLSSEQTETILLKIEGFSHAEIAEITNAKPETVKSRLRYATARLRTSMEVTI